MFSEFQHFCGGLTLKLKWCEREPLKNTLTHRINFDILLTLCDNNSMSYSFPSVNKYSLFFLIFNRPCMAVLPIVTYLFSEQISSFNTFRALETCFPFKSHIWFTSYANLKWKANKVVSFANWQIWHQESV